MLRPGLIQTIRGVYFDVLNPDPEQIDLYSIAHALGMICRYGGHSTQRYSVAQHSVYASFLVTPDKAKAALLHDATEAYIGDMVKPLKVALPQFNEIEDRLAGAVCTAFGLPIGAFDDPDIKAVDVQLMALEARELCANPKLVHEYTGTPDGSIYQIDPQFVAWEPKDATRAFMNRFMQIRAEDF